MVAVVGSGIGPRRNLKFKYENPTDIQPVASLRFRNAPFLAMRTRLGLALLALPAAAAADEAEALFDPSVVAEIDFTLPPNRFELEMNRKPRIPDAEITVKAIGRPTTCPMSASG